MTIPDRLAAALADRYRLERELGQGGMATVFLAEDLKHDRKVALKVLKPELAAVLGAERFVVEIKTTAALQHPHILPLFDSGTADGFLYYVMPYVAGETLRNKLDRETQLGIDEAVKLTVAVADALDYAHRQGVIHRDIKPENILLHDGRPMVADFGIALALSAAAGGRMTETGLSLGTPHYMSPEQATAEKEITARSDVYSLGAVLYEMLTGNPPHTGASAQQIIMKIVTEDAAPVTKLRRAVPPHVAAAVATAVEKLPADRFATAADFARALENPGYAGQGSQAGSGRADARTHRRAVPVLAGLALLASVLAAWGWLRTGGRPTPDPAMNRVQLGSSWLRNAGNAAVALAVSPTGGTIAFVDSVGPATMPGIPLSTGLFVKRPGQLEPERLTGADNSYGLAFSPDGGWIAYATFGGQLVKIPTRGGSPVVVADSAGGLAQAAWLDDGTIIYLSAFTNIMFTVADTGGPIRRVTTTDAINRGITYLAPLPRSRGALFEACGTVQGCTTSETWVYDHRTREVRLLLPGAGQAHYLPSGHLAYARPDGTVIVQQFDLETLELGGTPVQVEGGLARQSPGAAPAGVLRVSRDGQTALWLSGPAGAGGAALQDLVTVSTDGAVRPVPGMDSLPTTGVGGLELSPDGTRVAIDLADPASGRTDIHVKVLPDGPLTRLTFEGERNIRPHWSPDGRRLLWVSNRGGKDALWTQRADGSGAPEPLFEEERPVWDGIWSPDGEWLVYRTDNVAAGNGDIIALHLGDSTRVEVAATQFEETSPALSPDGRWIAFTSTRSGRTEVYVRPFPDVGEGFWQVSVDGGSEPIWAPDGRRLYYMAADLVPEATLMEATVTPGPGFGIAARRAVASGEWVTNPTSHFFDVFPSGKAFVLFRTPPRAANARGTEAALAMATGWNLRVQRALAGAPE